MLGALCGTAPRGRPLLERTVRPASLFGNIGGSSWPLAPSRRSSPTADFGFIAAEDEKEYFFHMSGVDPSLDFERLVGGERVEFDIEQSPKGPRAANVRAAA